MTAEFDRGSDLFAGVECQRPSDEARARICLIAQAEALRRRRVRQRSWFLSVGLAAGTLFAAALTWIAPASRTAGVPNVSEVPDLAATDSDAAQSSQSPLLNPKAPDALDARSTEESRTVAPSQRAPRDALANMASSSRPWEETPLRVDDDGGTIAKIDASLADARRELVQLATELEALHDRIEQIPRAHRGTREIGQERLQRCQALLEELSAHVERLEAGPRAAVERAGDTLEPSGGVVREPGESERATQASQP